MKQFFIGIFLNARFPMLVLCSSKENPENVQSSVNVYEYFGHTFHMYSLLKFTEAKETAENFTYGVNFINTLRTNFLYERRFGSFFYVQVTRE